MNAIADHSKAVKKARQTVARNEQAYALAQIQKRKQETRRKIEYGGLVVKAGLNEYSKDIILGGLLSVMEQLAHEPESKAIFAAKGEAAFLQ